MLKKILQSAQYFSTQCRLTLVLSIRIGLEISCAPITADLPWFVSSQYCLSPAECLDNSCSAAICFLSAGPIGNWLEACLSAMEDNLLLNQVVSIDTETF
jgi:hypothetical protein